MNRFNLMILPVLSLLAAFVSISPAFADLQCDLVDEHDSWSVYVQEGLELAMFFDNDHNTAMSLSEGGNLDHMGPQHYTFTGNDEGLVQTFELELSAKSAKGTLIEHGRNKKVKYPMTCHQMKAKDAARLAWDEVKAAIANAPANQGSTRF